MFDLGGGELLLILIAVLVFFGPKKLPELAQSLGRGVREFKRAQREFTNHINSAFEEEQRKSSRPTTPDTPRNTIAREPDAHPADLLPPAEDADVDPGATTDTTPEDAAPEDIGGASPAAGDADPNAGGTNPNAGDGDAEAGDAHDDTTPPPARPN